MGIHYILLHSFLLSSFPSGSSINYYHDKFFLIGDDSNYILILDRNYKKIDSLNLFNYTGQRIPKTEKIDLEGSTIIGAAGRRHLFVSGSGSGQNRKKALVIPISKKGISKKELKDFIVDIDNFMQRMDAAGIDEINVEGVTEWKGNLILGNRGNLLNKNNHLIITTSDFWKKQHDAPVEIKKLLMPDDTSALVLGLSELCYVKEHDVLFMTFSSEATTNSYDDGVIGDSFLAMINNASAKLKAGELHAENLINLTTVDAIFKNQKIEGICAEVAGNKVILNLISDNDNGQSHLFKLEVNLK
jgi:hypothetical protein